MTDLLRQGSDWLEQMRAAHCSSPVVYRRGGSEIEVGATYGRTQYEVEDDYGLRIKVSAMDFLITADDLGLEPEAGDVIAAEGRRFEVMDLGDEGSWRFSDPYRKTLRIHTKDIGND